MVRLGKARGVTVGPNRRGAIIPACRPTMLLEMPPGCRWMSLGVRLHGSVNGGWVAVAATAEPPPPLPPLRENGRPRWYQPCMPPQRAHRDAATMPLEVPVGAPARKCVMLASQYGQI